MVMLPATSIWRFFSFYIMTHLLYFYIMTHLTHSVNVLLLWVFLFCLFCKEFESIFRSSLFNSSPDFSLFFSIFHPKSFSLLSHTYTHGSVNCIFKHYQSIFFSSHIYFTEHICRCEHISQPVFPSQDSLPPALKWSLEMHQSPILIRRGGLRASIA